MSSRGFEDWLAQQTQGAPPEPAPSEYTAQNGGGFEQWAAYNGEQIAPPPQITAPMGDAPYQMAQLTEPLPKIEAPRESYFGIDPNTPVIGGLSQAIGSAWKPDTTPVSETPLIGGIESAAQTVGNVMGEGLGWLGNQANKPAQV